MATVAGTRLQHESRLAEERRKAERGKSMIVLMIQHLLDLGYHASADALQSESGVGLGQYEVADNIDLMMVVQEWEDKAVDIPDLPEAVQETDLYKAELASLEQAEAASLYYEWRSGN